MKPQMKLVLAVAAVWAGCLSAPAVIYNVNGDTMTLQKVNAWWIDDFFSASTGTNFAKVEEVHPTDAYYPSYGSVPYYSNREAFKWTAPVGETITQVSFLDTYTLANDTDAAAFMPVIYNLSGGALPSAEAIVWTSPATESSSATRVVTLPLGITSIGFGFSTSQWYGANLPVTKGSSVQFSDIVVTTPEPASLGLLAVGGLLLGRKRARR